MGAAWWQQISIERWARAATALMLLAVAWSLAQLTWLVLPGGTSEVGKAGAPVPVRQARSAPRLLPVADLSLFGRVEVAAATGAPVDAPETRLNLTLRGVLATGSAFARAIVAAQGGDEQSYRVGDNLPGGATLDQVLADRVILQRAGRYEALYLPKEADTGGSFDRVPGPGEQAAGPGGGDQVATSPAPDVGVQLNDVRQRILEDPSQAFNFARVQPVMEAGKLKGYKLSPNKDKQLFRQVGLRPGDVVTSVNGIALDDPATVGQVMSQLTTSSQLTLTVDRGGRQETVVVPFGQ